LVGPKQDILRQNEEVARVDNRGAFWGFHAGWVVELSDNYFPPKLRPLECKAPEDPDAKLFAFVRREMAYLLLHTFGPPTSIGVPLPK
jgi:hypothetical protein